MRTGDRTPFRHLLLPLASAGLASCLLCCLACRGAAQRTELPTSAGAASASGMRTVLTPEPTAEQEKLPRVARAKEFVLTCVRQRLTREQVIQRLGVPADFVGPTRMYHELAPDAMITLHFDEKGKVDHGGVFVSPWAFQHTPFLPAAKGDREQEPPKARSTENEPAVRFTKEDERALEAWLRLEGWQIDGGRNSAAQFAAMCLRHRLSRTRIARVIWRPVSEILFRDKMPRAMSCSWAPSQIIVFLFDEKDHVVATYGSGIPENVNGSLPPWEP